MELFHGYKDPFEQAGQEIQKMEILIATSFKSFLVFAK